MSGLIGLLAARQHGVVGLVDLFNLGLSRKAVARRLRNGSLIELFPGAFALSRANLTRRSYWMAATISTGPGSYLAQRSAAQLRRFADLIPGPVHVLVPHRRTLERPGIVIHRTRHLPASQVTTLQGIPVTTPERTLLDFAAVASPGELRDAVRAATRLEQLDHGVALKLCAEARGRTGRSCLAALLRERWGPITETDSPLEDLFLPICADFGIRYPAVSVPVLDYVVDCLWEPEGLIVELDGYEWHRDRESFEADRRRDAKLGVAGHSVLRFTDRRLRREREDVAADVISTLAALGSGRAAAG